MFASVLKISVMYLYTPEALEYLGDISVAQMISFIVDGIATANEALYNSDIDAEFDLVYLGEVRRLGTSAPYFLPYEQAACEGCRAVSQAVKRLVPCYKQ